MSNVKINKAKLRKLMNISFLKETLSKSYQQLDEADLYRIITTYMDLGFVILSSQRSCEAETGRTCSEEEEQLQAQVNKENDENLKNDLKSSGFGYLPVYGGFKEKNPKTGELVDSPNPEKSYIIVAKGKSASNNTDALKQFAGQLIKKYNQDSFLFKPSNQIDPNAYWITQTGDIANTFKGPIKADDLTQSYFTQLRRGSKKRFSFTEMTYWVPNPPGGVDIARQRFNEIFIRK